MLGRLGGPALLCAVSALLVGVALSDDSVDSVVTQSAPHTNDLDAVAEEDGSLLQMAAGHQEVTTESAIPSQNMWAFVIIVTTLMASVLIFQILKDFVDKIISRTVSRGIVRTLPQTLAALGFLALVAFLLSKVFVAELCTVIYGGRSMLAEDKSNLAVLLERIGNTIFFVMLLMMVKAYVVVIICHRKLPLWVDQEDLVITETQRNALMRKYRRIKKPSFRDMLCWAPPEAKDDGDDIDTCAEVGSLGKFGLAGLTYAETRDLCHFMLTRQKFLHENKKMKLTRGFGFSLYLGRKMGDLISAIPCLTWEVWVFTEVGAAVFLLLALAFDSSWEALLWVFLVAGWCTVLLCYAYQNYLNRMIYGLVEELWEPESTQSTLLLRRSRSVIKTPRDGRKLTPRERLTPREGQLSPRTGTSTPETSESGTPRDGEATEKMKQHIPSWLPAVHLCFLKCLYLATAVYNAVFYIQVMPSYVIEAYDPWVTVCIVIVQLIPTAIIYTALFVDLVASGVMLSAAGAFSSDRLIHEILRLQKEARAVYMLRLMVVLKQEDHDAAGGIHDEHQIDLLLERSKGGSRSSIEMEQMMSIFDAFDVNGDRHLSPTQLRQAFTQFGLNSSKADADDPIQKILTSITGVRTPRGSVVGDDHRITRDTFLVWMVGVMKSAAQLQPEEITQYVFDHYARTDSQGEEFLKFEDIHALFSQCLSQEQRMTPIEVSGLIAELDENDDGNFQFDEFLELIRKHSDQSIIPSNCCC